MKKQKPSRAASRLVIGRRGVAVGLTKSDIADLRRAYRARHFAPLPGLFDPELLAWALDALDAAEFRATTIDNNPRYVKALGPVDGTINARLSFLFNDPALFRVVEAITGCPPIGSFGARILRLVPGQGHHVGWHCDLPPDSRIVTMRLNLNREPFDGGRLQFRRARDEKFLFEYDNNIAGDAVLFKPTSEYHHRNSEVTGRHPRTTFSGWFYRAEPAAPESKGDALETALKRGGFSGPGRRTPRPPGAR